MVARVVERAAEQAQKSVSAVASAVKWLEAATSVRHAPIVANRALAAVPLALRGLIHCEVTL